MFGLEQRRLDQLAQLAVGKLGDAAIAEGIFVPEEAILITGPPNFHRIAKGVILTGRIDLATHPFAHGVDIGDLLANGRSPPAVNFEGGGDNRAQKKLNVVNANNPLFLIRMRLAVNTKVFPKPLVGHYRITRYQLKIC